MLRQALCPFVAIAGSEITLIEDDVLAACELDVVLTRGVVGDIIPTHCPAEFEGMLASCPAQVVSELVAGHIPTLRKGIVNVADPVTRGTCQIPIAARGIPFWYQDEGDGSCQGSGVGVGEDRPIIAGSEEELVSEHWREGMRLVQLPFIRRLRAFSIKNRVDKAGSGRLGPVIYLEVNKEVIVGSKVE